MKLNLLRKYSTIISCLGTLFGESSETVTVVFAYEIQRHEVVWF